MSLSRREEIAARFLVAIIQKEGISGSGSQIDSSLALAEAREFSCDDAERARIYADALICALDSTSKPVKSVA